MRVLLAVGVLGVVLAGCGQGAEPGDTSSGPAATSTAVPTTGPTSTGPTSSQAPGAPTATDPRPTAVMPIAPGEPLAVSPSQIDDSAVSGGYHERATLGLDGTTVNLVVIGGACDESSARILAQGERSVSVALVSTVTSSGPCAAYARYDPVSVTLDQPLGARTLVLSELTE